MNKYQLYTLGGALLAATSLAGTAAQAAATGYYDTGAFTSKAKIISNLTFSPTAATANAQQITGSGTRLGMEFTNSYAKGFNLNITVPITGATFVGTPSVSFLMRSSANNSSGTVVGTIAATGINPGGTNAVQVSALSNSLFINNAGITQSGTVIVNGASANQIGGFILHNVTFANAAGLATAGSSVSLSATVANQASLSQIFETVAASPIITSAAPIATVITAGTAAQANASTATPFTSLVQPNGSLSIILASVGITATGALATDLTTIVNADGVALPGGSVVAGSGNLSLEITSPVLTDGAAGSLTLVQKNGNQTVFGTVTTAAFSSGAVSFTLSAGTNTYTETTYVTVQYNGTTGISAEAAGTVTATYTTNTYSLVAPASATGATTVVTHGVALSTQVDWATDAAGGLPSYLRIHNNGAANTAFVVVKLDAQAVGGTVTTLGTYTTASVPAGGTIQVGVPTIEAALGITPSASNTYTLLVSAPFAGYVQHLQLTPSNTLVDLDGFRAGAGAAP